MHTDAIRMGLSIIYFKGPQVYLFKFSNNYVLLFLKSELILENSAGPEKTHFCGI